MVSEMASSIPVKKSESDEGTLKIPVKESPISILELMSPSEDPGSRRDPVGK